MGVSVKGITKIGTFSPLNISGLQLWLDASDPTTLFQDSAATTLAGADGDPVGCWKDKSGNGKDATQTDGTLKPLLKTSIQNSRPVLRFDNTNDFLSLAQITQQTPSYVFAAVRTNNMGGDARSLLNRTTDSAPYPPALYLSTSSYARVPSIYWGTGSADLYYTNPITQAPHIIIFRIDLGSIGITVDSGSEQVRTHSQTVLSSWNAVSTPYFPQTLNADVCELMLFHSSLSASDKLSTLNYLNYKWSIF